MSRKIEHRETYLQPKKAGKKLKLAKELRQTAYLYGITGIGKTALVENVLRAHPCTCYSAAKSAMDEMVLPDRGEMSIFVVDDLQEVSENNQEEFLERLHTLAVRDDVWLVLISRSRIPQWLMPLHLENEFLVINEEDFFFDRVGQDAFFEQWGITLPIETADKIWELAGGNPMFLRCVALAGGDLKQAVSDLWSCFFQMYDQWEPELQEFLMEMSVVGRFDVQMAQIVTGRAEIQRLLKKATEMGNFLREKDGVYEFHFVLRGCIRENLFRKFDREQVSRIYYNAGHMYEIRGDIANALRMYEDGGDKKSIFRILAANARQNPASGHYFELRHYYLMLPEEIISTSPVLMAGMSMLQSILLNIGESERWYQKLKEFAGQSRGSAKQEAKNRLLYLDIGLPHRGTFGMVDLLKHAAVLLKGGKTVLPEFSVTSNLPSVMNGGKDFCEWSRQDQELAASVGKIVEFVLGKYGKGLAAVALAESYFEKGCDTYAVVSLAEKGRMQAEAGGKTELAFAAVGILVWLSVVNGRAGDALDILEGFQKSVEKQVPQLLPNLHALCCRIYLYQGKIPMVLKWLETAPDENKDFCTLKRFEYLTKIRCYIQFGKYSKAYSLLQKMSYYADMHQRNYISMEVKILLSIVQRQIRDDGWEAQLQEALSQAESYHFVRILSREGGAVLKLLRAGEFCWEQEDFRKQAFRECEQMEKFYPAYLKEKTAGDIALSKNAADILRLQAEGYQNAQIAKMLDISVNTVKYHSKETYRKLGVNSKTAAVSEAKNRGLI